MLNRFGISKTDFSIGFGKREFADAKLFLFTETKKFVFF